MAKNKTLFYGMGSAVLLPEIIELGEAIAARVPEGHWLRSKNAYRVLGVLAARVKNKSYDISSPANAALLQRAASFIRHTAYSLGRSPVATKAVPILEQAWVGEFLKEAEKRLAHSANPEEELERLKEKFDLLNKMREMMQ